MADSGPGGIPDGVLGIDDLVADTGDRLQREKRVRADLG